MVSPSSVSRLPLALCVSTFFTRVKYYTVAPWWMTVSVR